MVVASLGREDLKALNLPNDVKGGVAVVEVFAGGLAASAGIQPGDIIVAVNDRKVEDLETFYKKLGKDDAVVLKIYRKGVEQVVSVNAKNAVPPLAQIAGPGTSNASASAGNASASAGNAPASAGNAPDTSSSNRSAACICLYCGTQVLHPAGVACADLECPVCGQRMASLKAGAVVSGPSAIPPLGQSTAGVPSAIPPLGQPTAGVPSAIPPMGQPTAGVPSAIPPMGQPTAGVPSAIPPLGQIASGVPDTIPPMGQPTDTGSSSPSMGGMPDPIPPMGPREGVGALSDTMGTAPSTGTSMAPQVERPDSRPPAIGGPSNNMTDLASATAVTYIPVAFPTVTGDTVLSYVPVGGQPDNIPPMGQTTGGQPDNIPPVGRTTGGQPDRIPPIGQSTGGKPDDIPPMGQTTGGQPDNVPLLGQMAAGAPVAGASVAGGAPVGSIPPSNLPNAGTTPSTSSTYTNVCVCPVCFTTVYHPIGTPCSSMTCPICGSRLVNPSAGQTAAGAPVGSIPPSNLPSATDDDAAPGSSGQGAANLVRTLPTLPTPVYTLLPSADTLAPSTMLQPGNTLPYAALLPSDTTYPILYPRANLGQGPRAAPTTTNVAQIAGGVPQAGTAGQGGAAGQGGGGGQGGYCVCPVCGKTVEHVAGTPCTQVSCPVCGTMMVRATSSTVAGAAESLPTVAVAIAGSTLESNLAVFETATNYVIIDLNTGKAQIVPNPNANDPSNTGTQSAQLVVDRGADTVIASSFGQMAVNALSQLRAEAMTSLFGSVQDAITSYFNMLKDSNSQAPSQDAAQEEGKKYGLMKERSSGKTKGDEGSL